MAGRDIIVIGASAGGVQAILEIVSHLPADLPAAVFVVLHINPYGRSALPDILSRYGVLPAHHPEDGEVIRPGKVYVAPPDFHLAIQHRRVRLSHGPSENGHRPAVDVLFRTAARAFQQRVVGVVLSGNLDDGTSGLSFIKQHGGTAIVQDPDEADYAGMPESAVRNVQVDHVLPLAGIAPLLDTLARNSFPPGESVPADDAEDPGDMRWEPDFELEPGGTPSGLTCPDCGGVLWENAPGQPLHFRCRTGHAFSPESLAAKQSESLEAALWAALRALEENAALARGMAKRMNNVESLSGRRFLRKAETADKHVAQLRALLHEKIEPEME